MAREHRTYLVQWDEERNKWCVKIEDENLELGCREKKEKAVEFARQKAAQLLHSGEIIIKQKGGDQERLDLYPTT